jgi:hypothetical protein
VHRHAGGALHQRLDDDGGDLVGALGEQGFDVLGGAARHVLRRFAVPALRASGELTRARRAQQRAVGILEQGDVGDGQRADGLAVVAALQADEFLLVGVAGVAPVMKTHLQRDLDRRGAVRGIEGVAERGRSGAASCSDSSITGSWVKPASIACSSVSSWSFRAALMRGLAWPNRLTHHELMPSR